MRKLSKILGIAAITAAAFSMSSAQAFWGGGPWGGYPGYGGWGAPYGAPYGPPPAAAAPADPASAESK